MIQESQCFLHFFHSGGKLFPLVFQDIFSVFDGSITPLNQGDIFNQHFNWKSRAPHALDEINPPEVKFVVIPNASFSSVDGWDETNPFVITKRIG
jgi:hypothetical protein